jgi:hypothetical protein
MAGSFISSRTGAPLKVPIKLPLSSSSQERIGRLSTCASAAATSLISRLFCRISTFDAPSVDEKMPVPHELPRLGASEREAEAVDDVVEARLEEAEHLLACAPFAARRVEVILLELALEYAIDTTHLLLFAEADRVLAQLHARLAVLAGRIGAPGVRALLREAALTFQEELRPLAATKLANSTVVPSHGYVSLRRDAASAADIHCGEQA